jgi:surface protein
MRQSTSTPPSCVCCCFFHLNSVHSRLVAFFFYVFSILIIFGFCPPRHRHPPTAFKDAFAFNADISKWITAAVTDMLGSTSTPPSCFCCWFFHLNSVHSRPLLFFTFSRCYLFLDSVQSRHRPPPTAFLQAKAFNGDISKWNTSAVTSMRQSTSTPPLCFCCCFFHLNSVHSQPLLFLLPFSQFLPAVASNEHCAAVPGCL